MKHMMILTIIFAMNLSVASAACINDNCNEHANRVHKNTKVRILTERPNAAELRQRCETDELGANLKKAHPKYTTINNKLVAQGAQQGNKYVEVVLNENSNACEIVMLQLVE